MLSPTRPGQCSMSFIIKLVVHRKVLTGLLAHSTMKHNVDGAVQGVANGSLTVGDAVLFVTLIQQLYAPLNYFVSVGRHPRGTCGPIEELCEHTNLAHPCAVSAQRHIIAPQSINERMSGMQPDSSSCLCARVRTTAQSSNT